MDSANQNGRGTCKVRPLIDGRFTLGGVVVDPAGPLLLYTRGYPVPVDPPQYSPFAGSYKSGIFPTSLCHF